MRDGVEGQGLQRCTALPHDDYAEEQRKTSWRQLPQHRSSPHLSLCLKLRPLSSFKPLFSLAANSLS